MVVEIAKPSPKLERLGSFTLDPILTPTNNDNGSNHQQSTRIQPSYGTEQILATPAVRRLAKDHGLDLAQVFRGSPETSGIIQGKESIRLSTLSRIPD